MFEYTVILSHFLIFITEIGYELEKVYINLNVLMFYLSYTLATKNVLRFNINKVLSSNQENDNLFLSLDYYLILLCFSRHVMIILS